MEVRIVPRLPTDAVPLTYTQLARWNAFQVIGMGRNTRTCSIAMRLPGKLDIKIMQRSFDELVRRHESLRTRIVAVRGIPMQTIDEAGDGVLEITDLPKMSKRSVEIEARRVVEDVVNEPTDMAVGPLFKARLLKLDACDYVLVVAIDHIVADFMSLGLLMRDVQIAYTQGAKGILFALPKMPIQFADFAVWQQKTHQWRMAKQSGYATEHFRGASRIPLPVNATTVPATQRKWTALPFQLEKAMSAGLDGLGRRSGTTLAMTVLTLFVALLLRWFNQKDVVVGFATTGRHQPGVMNTIGFFACTIYLRIELQETDSFQELLRRVTFEYFTAIEHQDFGLSAVCSPQPAFAQNASFNWFSSPRTIGGAEIAPSTTASFPFVKLSPEMEWDDDLPIYGGEPWLNLSGNADGITGHIKYRPVHFASSSMERFGRTLQLFAKTVLQNPEACVATMCTQ